jgi:hypothetical protein
LRKARPIKLSKVEAEPLLPIEKKLIGWSLGIGLTLLVILAIVNHYLPAAPTTIGIVTP